MSVADIVIIAAVVLAVALIARSFVRKSVKGSCAGCSSESSCSSAHTGTCSAAEDMVADARAAVAEARRNQGN